MGSSAGGERARRPIEEGLVPGRWTIFLTVCFLLSEWAFSYLAATVEGRRGLRVLWVWFFVRYPAAAWGLLVLARSFQARGLHKVLSTIPDEAPVLKIYATAATASRTSG